MKAGEWTKVVIDWSSYKDGNVQVQHIYILASTGGTCTAGNYVTLTGFKMSSMYIVDDASSLDALIKATDEVQAVIDVIDELSLATLESDYSTVLAQYNALSDTDKALVTNADKLTALEGMTVIQASTLTQANGTVTFTNNTDETYGLYGELTHSGAWAAVKYVSDMQLQNLDKDLVVYMYNPGSDDVPIAFGYLNESHTEQIYGNQCYKYETLKAGEWTKVVIDWSSYKDGSVQLQHIYMVASNLANNANCTAGSGENLTGFKMSSMYIVDDASSLDEFIARPDEVKAVIKAIDELNVGTYQDEMTDVIEQYDALSETEQALVTNADKLTTLKNMTVISANTLAQANGTVTIISDTDETYGLYGELMHTADWVAVKYASGMQLQNLDKDLVVYMYNPGPDDVPIAFGYLNESHTEQIYGNQCYKYETLKAGAWTKVVIDWSSYKEGSVQLQHIYILASNLTNNANCTAGNGVNLTGFKISSLYIVDDADNLD